MNIVVNGEQQKVEDGLTVAGILENLGLKAQKIAVERNLEIVPRSDYAKTVLAEGDRLEIVHFIGGGR